VSQQSVGHAGMKDTRAVTRQFISVPARCEKWVSRINSSDVKVLRVCRNDEKLRVGHLRGNRFNILVRRPHSEGLARSRRILEQIERFGLANYYDSQRFGHQQRNVEAGKILLTQEGGGSVSHELRRVASGEQRFLRRLYASALQSALFNEVLYRRMSKGTLHRILPGDIVMHSRSGIEQRVRDVAADQAKLDAKQLCPMGPMFGAKMLAARDEAAKGEDAVLDAVGMCREHFDRYPKLTPGARRAMIVWPKDMSVQEDPQGLRFNFTLPPGCYATVLMEEVMKVRLVTPGQ
ncbi:MAG: tRNA pseudouridine(13) synthase TruD, partial [Myxococcota bacterium]